MKKWKIDQWLVVATLACASIVVMLGAGYLYFERREVTQIDTRGHPTIGSLDASVEMVVFEEMKCSACRDFQQHVFPKIHERYIQTGRVRYTTILVSFLQGSQMANLAALGLYMQNRELFFPFLHYIFSLEFPEEANWATLDAMCEMASHIPGADIAHLRASLADERYAQKLEENFQLGEKIMKETFSTPAIFINGVRVYSVTETALMKKIEEAMNRR